MIWMGALIDESNVQIDVKNNRTEKKILKTKNIINFRTFH